MKVNLFYEKTENYMSTSIIGEKKNGSGVERVYPVCNKAKILTALTGNKTLLDVDIKLIKQLGYTLTTKREEL